jgi:hypothetical protein
LRAGVTPRALDIPTLQRKLREDHAYLGTD